MLKKGLYSELISDFTIFRPKIRWSSDIARYNLWNVFHLKYFPRLQCATTNPPMRRMLATPGLDALSNSFRAASTNGHLLPRIQWPDQMIVQELLGV